MLDKLILEKLRLLKPDKKKVARFLFEKYASILFLAIAMFLGLYLEWNKMEVLIFMIFIWIIINPVASRIIIFPALALILLTALLLIFDARLLAEDTAVYAYFFLAMAAMMGIYELRREKSGE